MKKKILIVSSSGLSLNQIRDLKDLYKKANILHCKDNKVSVMKNIMGCNALINCPRNIFSSDLLAEAIGSLDWVHIGGAGCEEYLFPEFVNSNITLTNGKIVQGPEVSDHAIALLLSITRNLNYVLKNKTSEMPRPIEIKNKKIIIFGVGGIGGLIAEKLSAFGAYIIGVDEKLVPMNSFIDEFYYHNDIEKVVNLADIIICAAPHTKVTNNFFSNDLFKKMKNGIIFINVSRGQIVDTKALTNFLIKGKFLGVGLDVIDPEPLPKNHILRRDLRVIISPHIAGPSDYNRMRSLEILKKNIKNYIHGHPLINIVNKKLGY